jgi:quercetin dioxygenase-like cupin family protein
VKIIKRSAADIPKEEAHGGAGSRKVIASPDYLKSTNLDGMTHGWLPAGNSFDWHDHKDIEEIMFVLKGEGVVADEDGEYGYAPDDVFIFPADTMHKITNNSNEEHEMIFVRVKL